MNFRDTVRQHASVLHRYINCKEVFLSVHVPRVARWFLVTARPSWSSLCVAARITRYTPVDSEDNITLFWANVCKTVRPMLSDPCLSVCLSVCPACPVCLSCLSVTLAYCGQAVGWIQMKLGMLVGLDSGNIVLDGDPARPPTRRTPLIFRQYLLWPNGWMDQDAT